MFTGEIEADCCLMFDILSQMDYKSGADRYKLCPTKKGNGSVLWGNTWRAFLKYDEEGMMITRKPDPNCPGKYMSKAMEQHPELGEIFKVFRDFHFPTFEFSHVMMNRNFEVSWHRDKANIGESVVIAFGDFTGGRTQIQDEDGTITNLDTLHSPHKFDGSKILHRCEPFVGNRYSLVFFKN